MIVLDDRFDLGRQVGMGAMGAVYEAWDRRAEGRVAIKILHAPQSAPRFMREAAILAELDHPAIVRYISHGTSAKGEPYLVMEWLDGQTLEGRLGAGPLSIEESLALARRVIDGLAVAHRRGVVHRDLKPSNLFLPGGVAAETKILDFGIAWRISDDHRLTQTGAVLGTPRYMSPEQARGDERVDERADIYSLGAVLLECLTGKPAFFGASPMAILCKICLDEPPRLTKLLPGAPLELDALLRRMLAKDPAARPGDALSLAMEVAAISGSGRAASNEPPRETLTEDEQRVLSAIFVSGSSTKSGESASAATTSAALGAPSEDVLGEILSAYGAQPEQLIDGSMVITFAGSASTDQAATAARCALSLRELLVDVPMVVCTGRKAIHGRVQIGEVIDRGADLLGTALPGAVRLDAPTAGLLDARFVVEGQDPDLYLKDERELDEAPRTVLGKTVSCLGREPDLALLDGIFESAASSESRAVLVTGAAGAGKSRLRQEFVRRLQRRGEKFRLLVGRADSLRAGSPFALVASSVRWAAGLSGRDPLEVRRQKLHARTALHLQSDQLARVTEFLGELTGTSFADDASPALRAARQEARLMSDQIRAAWLDWLRAECSKEPVLMVLEDIHWSDAQSVHLVGSALGALRSRPLMVLALARPEVSMRFERLWEEHGLQTFPLSPLTRGTCRKLVAEVLGEESENELTTRIVEQADGNPFFLEELLRAVAVGQTRLPETVLGMVQSRLDALGESGRILRAASVFGESFSVEGVRALVGLAGTSSTEELLQTLVDREVIVRKRGTDDYAFRHAIVREASYATLTDGDRVLGHRLAGEWLERVGESDPMVLADHFDRGGDRGRAALWYARSASYALQRNDLEAAIERAERARACGAIGRTLSESAIVRAQAHYWRGECSLAVTSAQLALAHSPVATAQWFHGVRELIGPLVELGRFDEVAEWSAKVDEVGSSTPEEAEAQVTCLCWCGGALANAGNGGYAARILDHAERIFAAMISGDGWAKSRLHYARGLQRASSDDLIGSIRDLELAIEGSYQAGDVRTACGIRGELGFHLAMLGDLERAESILRAVLEEARRRSLVTVEAFVLPDLADVLITFGRMEEARSMLSHGIEFAEAAESGWAQGTVHFAFSALEYRSRDYVASERHAFRSAEILRQCRPARCAALAWLARALLAQNRSDEALDAARQATAILQEIGTTKYAEPLVRLMKAETLMAVGDEAGAKAAILEARDRLVDCARRIDDDRLRQSFLSRLPENARTLQLAAAWCEVERPRRGATPRPS